MNSANCNSSNEPATPAQESDEDPSVAREGSLSLSGAAAGGSFDGLHLEEGNLEFSNNYNVDEDLPSLNDNESLATFPTLDREPVGLGNIDVNDGQDDGSWKDVSLGGIDDVAYSGNSQRYSPLLMGDLDDPDFDGGGKAGEELHLENNGRRRNFDAIASDEQLRDGADDPDFDEVSKVGLPRKHSDSSSSTIVTGQTQKRQSGSNTSSSTNTKKQKGDGKKKDKKSSEAAKKREFSKFKRWFDLWMANELNGIAEEWPRVDADFLDYARHMIEHELDMDEHTEHTKKRLLYVIEENNCSGKTMAEMWWMTVKAMGKVPRGIGYEKNECPVCKVAERKIIDRDHDCPYCHVCFNESGWKKKCVKSEDCKYNHDAEN